MSGARAPAVGSSGNGESRHQGAVETTQVPLELSFRDVNRSSATEALIRRRADKLHRFSDRIVSCRVSVERPHKHPRSGSPYRVCVEVTLPPTRDLVVRREPGEGDIHDELPTVINGAFDAMERRVERAVARDSGDEKSRDEDRALVVRLFHDRDYGFLETPDGRDVYFHRNAVLHDDFDRLEVGTEVRYEQTMGRDGPQASTVQIVNKPGARHGEGLPGELSPPPDWSA